ncbi:MAG: cupin domain-containing protein [Parachlamydiaceae bacterium]|nr:cupin domain-containing protein [Parachlamydiaceae bacterium]
MGSTHLFHLGKTKPQIVCQGGTRTDATIQNLPVLKGMSLSLLKLDPKMMREPHWHPNAVELGYCVSGKGLMTIFSPGSVHETFTIEPGTLSFVPEGSMHHIENIGDTPLQMLLCFNHENPEEINLSTSIGVMPNHILGDTFSLKPTFFAGLPKSEKPVFITQLTQTTTMLINWMTNRYKFNVEGVIPQVHTKGGWVKMSNGFLMPTLEGISLYSLRLEQNGAREPHWHPNAHELNYLLEGQARITLFSPGGDVDTFDMVPGDMSFLPRGYLHHIENTGPQPARFAIFFNNVAPSDIGLSGCLGAYSNDVLASIFKVPVSYFDALPKHQSDLFVVGGG